MLVIGYGSIGKRYIQNLSKIANIEIFVLTNRKIDHFLKTKKCKIVKTITEAISVNLDFAIIANETNYHTKFVKKLVDSSIHVLIEKPLANSLTGIDSILKTVKRKNLVTLMGYNLRFHPCISKIKELIDKKKLGTIISVHVENGSYLPNWHPGEDYVKSYAARKELGGGVVLTSSHEIDYLYWFFGDVKEIFSITGKFSNLKTNIEDHSSILLKFKNNIVAEVHLDYYQIPTSRYCKILTSTGTLYWNFQNNVVKFYSKKQQKWVILKKLSNYDYNQMYFDELKHFIKCIKYKSKSVNDITQGAKTLEIAIGIKKSSMKKRSIKL